MYVPGSLPPITYSDDGKKRDAPSAMMAAGSAIVHDGRAAAGAYRSFPRAAAIRIAASAMSAASRRPNVYAPAAARASAKRVVIVPLRMTAQKARSSAGSAARRGRSATGRR